MSLKPDHRRRIRRSRSFEESSVGASFSVRHFAGRVEYKADDFLDCNRECRPDDLVSVFAKPSCSFGFCSHLFATELKILQGTTL